MKLGKYIYAVLVAILSISNAYANGALCDGVFGSARVDILEDQGVLIQETDRFVGNIDIVDKTTIPHIIEGTWTHVSANGDRWLISEVTSVSCIPDVNASIFGYGTLNGGVDEYWIQVDVKLPSQSSGYCPATSYSIVACAIVPGDCNVTQSYFLNRWGYISTGTFQIR